ncbi:hypothetical protein SCHPADRAFT_436064 [Schizopora paradoxa]|uniref:Uncharacterized protein n=1 Tax=Schizopora paradoxa TaxID=27342 RepID=A0A0H2RJF0_9AGAM|nr:hypothetical protein SCHPADRAFT_436064 [Schizopora paradoxa]
MVVVVEKDMRWPALAWPARSSLLTLIIVDHRRPYSSSLSSFMTIHQYETHAVTYRSHLYRSSSSTSSSNLSGHALHATACNTFIRLDIDSDRERSERFSSLKLLGRIVRGGLHRQGRRSAGIAASCASISRRFVVDRSFHCILHCLSFFLPNSLSFPQVSYVFSF